MGFLSDLKSFEQSHPFKTRELQGFTFHYLLCGNTDSPFTLVYFVGGTGNPLGWHGHVTAMEEKYRILLVDYPMGLENMETLARLIGELTEALGIQRAVWIGASLGGYVAQLMAKQAPERTEAMVLYATTALTAKGIEDLKRQYKAVGLLLWLMEHVPYNALKFLTMKPTLARMIPKEDPAQAAYLREFADWIYGDYTKEKDLHMTRLMADLVNVTPVTVSDFSGLRGRTLLILPRQDQAFPKEMQQDLIDLLPGARVEYSDGGHLDTLCRAEQFAALTDGFLKTI